MYSSEYLRNKKLAAQQTISPPRGVPASLRTQIVRFANSGRVVTPRNAGQVVLLSAEGVIANKGKKSICCASVITTQTVKPAKCCDLINPTQYPRGFYGPVKPDCCPINGPPITGLPCCYATRVVEGRRLAVAEGAGAGDADLDGKELGETEGADLVGKELGETEGADLVGTEPREVDLVGTESGETEGAGGDVTESIKVEDPSKGIVEWDIKIFEIVPAEPLENKIEELA